MDDQTGELTRISNISLLLKLHEEISTFSTTVYYHAEFQ